MQKFAEKGSILIELDEVDMTLFGNYVRTMAVAILVLSCFVLPPEASGLIRILDNDWEEKSRADQPIYYGRIRMETKKSFATGGFGRANSWQDFGASFGLKLRPKLWMQISPGVGLHRNEGIGAPDIRFFQDLRSISLHTGARYYFWKVFPVFIQGGLGGVRWSGDIDPSRTIDENQTSPIPLTESDYSGTGLFTDFELGFSYTFKKGFFIDYRLAGISKSFVLSSDLQSGQTELEDNIKDSLEDLFSYGLLNIRLGYIW